MAATPCLSCALCCDGSLFAFVAISSDEGALLKATGIAVHDEHGKLKLAQRCGALDGCACRVYPQRPWACHRFDCLLMRAFTDKELPLEEALAVVNEAKRKLSRLEGLLPRARHAEPLGPVLRAAKLHREGVRLSDAALQAFEEAEEYLRRHFVPG